MNQSGKSNYFSHLPIRRNHPLLIEDNDSADVFLYHVSFPDFFQSILFTTNEHNDLFSNLVLKTVDILDGERPDQLSSRLYGSVQYYWTFFVINDHIRMGEFFQWPLSGRVLARLINDFFPGTVLISKNFDNAGEFTGNGLFREFSVGDRVSGKTSGASGYIIAFRREYGQMILRDVEGNFETDGETIELIDDESPSSMIEVDIDSAVRHWNAPHSFVDSDGIIVNHPDFVETNTSASDVFVVTINEAINDKNRRLSTLRVLDPDSIVTFSKRYKDLMKIKYDSSGEPQ